MGVLPKLGLIFVILVIVAILLYLYDRPLFLSLLSFMYSTVSKQNTTTSSSGITSGLITNVTPYYENATVKNDLAQIEKVIPANEIKAVRTFVNPSTNFTTQLESYNDFGGFGNTNNTYIYYNGTYAPSGLFGEGDIYNNGTFTNYMPWLQGKIVYVQFPVGAIGGKPPIRYVNLPYLVTKVYEENGKFYYNFTHEFGVASSIIFNFTPTLAQGYNLTNEALGFFYNGTEYIVGR